MTADRELLELAAKAAGFSALGEWDEKLGHMWDGEGWSFDPLEDDGDALRLAATLRLCVLPGKHIGDGCTVEAQRAGIAGCTVFRDGAFEQMRRAIVMAAAEIGRAMP